MHIAIVLYDRFTVLDAIGPYQVLSGLPDAEVVFAAEQAGPVADEKGSLLLTATAAFADVPRPDIVVVPGGPGQRDQMQNGPLHEWLRSADATTTWTTSVCTGSLILAAAGLLAGRRATSHWLALDELGPLGATAVSERVVFDGKYVTAAGVSAGIDMALTLAGRIAGDDVAQAIQLMIEYDPHPPYDAGSPDRAPAGIVNHLRGRRTAPVLHQAAYNRPSIILGRPRVRHPAHVMTVIGIFVQMPAVRRGGDGIPGRDGRRCGRYP